MNTGVCIAPGATLRQAGHRMRELGVSALPVRGADGAARGTVSRDMIVQRIAAGGDPRTVTVEELAAGMPGAAGSGGTAAGALSWRLGSPMLALRALGQQARHAA